MKWFMFILLAFLAVCFAFDKPVSQSIDLVGTEINQPATDSLVEIIGQNTFIGGVSILEAERPSTDTEQVNEMNYPKTDSMNIEVSKKEISKNMVAELGRCSNYPANV